MHTLIRILATTATVALVAFSFAGCALQPGSSSPGPGSGSGSGSGSSGPNMQAGQWEFALTPSTGTPFYIEADLVQNGSNLVSATTTTALLLVGSGPIANSFSACFNVSLTSTGENGIFTGTVSESRSTLFELSGSVTGNGQTVSGSYTIGSLSTACMFYSVSSGTYTGYIVPPFTGSYTGSMSLSVSQDSNFNITANGTAGSDPVSIVPSGSGPDDLGGYRNAIGAIVEAIGYVSGPSVIDATRLFGHENPNGSSITYVTIVPAAQGTPVWPVESGSITYGTLTKQ